MSDFNSAWLAGVAALDELVAIPGLAPAGFQNATTQLGSVASLQSQLATRTQERDTAATLAGTRRTVIDGMIADLNAAGAADATEDAADVTGDAKRAAALAKAQGAP